MDSVIRFSHKHTEMREAIGIGSSISICDNAHLYSRVKLFHHFWFKGVELKILLGATLSP